MSSLKTGVLAEPVLVGREKELEELQHFLAGAIRGQGNTVFISGEAGSGKTRLTREFLKAAVRQGVAVMAGWCLSDSQAPFFPFIEAFNSYYALTTEEQASISFQQPQPSLDMPAHIGMEEQEITSWLTGPKPTTKRGKAEMLSPQVWKDQALAAVANTVHTIALQAPFILFIEDLHWADSASLALLHYLARAIHGSERVLLLATFRSEELTTDAEGHPHPLAETLRVMRREELFSEVKLPSLDQKNVSKLAQSMVGSCVQQEFTEKLTAQSGGSPLFIVESLRLLNEHGGLVRDGACVRLDIDKVVIPSKVKDIILRRVGSLRRDQRRVLDAASVIGETFDLELLGSVLGQDSLLVVETLSAIAQSTPLLVCEGDVFRFDHAKSREALYEEIPLPLKKSYHARVAEKLEILAKEGVFPLSDLTYHYVQAGNIEKAVKFALAAGKDARLKFSNSEAIKHFQYVLQNVAEGNAVERRDALEGLGDAYYVSCMYGEAIKTFELLAASETGLVKLHAFRKASDAAYAKGDVPDLLIDYAEKAVELGVEDRLEMARIIDNRGLAWGWGGRGTAKQDLADYDAALQVFEEENSLADVAEALWRSGTLCALFFDETRERGLGELFRSVAIFKELGDVRKEIQATFWKGQGLEYNGFLVDAKREFAEVLTKGEKLGIFNDMHMACSHLTAIALLEERIEEALSYALKDWEYVNKTDSKLGQGVSAAFLAAVYSVRGDIEKADEYFAKSTELLPPEHALNPIFHVQIYWGIYYASKGRWDKSGVNFKRQLEHFERSHSELGHIKAVKQYIWALEKQGCLEEARVQSEKLQELSEHFREMAEKKFGHANLQLSLMLQRKTQVGSDVEMRLDFLNIGRKPGDLVKVEDVVAPGFKFLSLPSFCDGQGASLAIRDKSVGHFEVENVKLRLSATRAGIYNLNPVLVYLDELGNTKTFEANPIAITVEAAKPTFETLPGRVPTGTAELDRLLLGGIPEGCAVVLASPSSDERELVINRFIEAGAENGEITVYLTCDANKAEELARSFQTNFYVSVCNPQADSAVSSLPNIIKLRGTENLTDIDIALAKLFRTLNLPSAAPKRFCVDVLSDVLLQHHAVVTRRWLSGLLASLKSKGFTTLAVIDPSIASEEVSAISSLFDGEIVITEKETAKGPEKILRVRKLVNQKYLEDELVLTKEKLSS